MKDKLKECSKHRFMESADEKKQTVMKARTSMPLKKRSEDIT